MLSCPRRGLLLTVLLACNTLSSARQILSEDADRTAASPDDAVDESDGEDGREASRAGASKVFLSSHVTPPTADLGLKPDKRTATFPVAYRLTTAEALAESYVDIDASQIAHSQTSERFPDGIKQIIQSIVKATASYWPKTAPCATW